MAFILSDVVGDAAEYVASGPTMIDTSSSASHALDIIRHYELFNQMPGNVISYLEQKVAQETSAIETDCLLWRTSSLSALLAGRELHTHAAKHGEEDPRAALVTANTMSKSREVQLHMMRFNVQNVLIGNNRIALEGTSVSP